jgi:hypothetical protein
MPKKGVVPPQLRPFLFKKGAKHKRGHRIGSFMARRRRHSRRGVRRFHRRYHKAKPSLGLIAGGLVGPAALAFGYGPMSGALWAPQFAGNRTQEAIDRLSILYLGYKPSDGTTWSLSNGGFLGTAALAGGYIAHKVGAWTGLNRMLARMKFPVRL